MSRNCRTFGPRPLLIILCLHVVLLFMAIQSQYFKNGFKVVVNGLHTCTQTTAQRHVKTSIERTVDSQPSFPMTRRHTHYPVIKLEKDMGCTKRKYGGLSLSNQILPLTALASPPRSGNTWVRHLLQFATGIGTSSVYCDRQLQSNGFPYECSHRRLNRTIVVKTHRSETRDDIAIAKPHVNVTFDRVVLLIRDPYNFIVANIHKGHLDEVKEDDYFKEEWRKRQPGWLKRWRIFNRFWLTEFKGPVYPLLYSNLLNDTETEVRKVLNFLRVTYTEADVRCALDNKEGNFHRKTFVWTQIKDITELFDNSIKENIELDKKALTKYLKKYRVNWVNETHTVTK